MTFPPLILSLLRHFAGVEAAAVEARPMPRAAFAIPEVQLLNLVFERHEVDTCPLCARQLSIDDKCGFRRCADLLVVLGERKGQGGAVEAIIKARERSVIVETIANVYLVPTHGLPLH